MAQRVHAQLATIHDLGFFGHRHFARRNRLLAAQQRADAFDQQALRERLFHIVVGAHAQTQNFVDLIIFRGQKDHRHLGFLAQALQQIHAIHARHLDIQHSHVRKAAVKGVEGRLAVIIRFNLKAFSFESH